MSTRRAMAPIGSRHGACVRRLHRLFMQELGERVLVDVQNPIVLHDRSEPLPDVMLLQPRDDLYASGHPRPSDVLLEVEVADTSLAYDQQIKVPAYARSEIPIDVHIAYPCGSLPMPVVRFQRCGSLI